MRRRNALILALLFTFPLLLLSALYLFKRDSLSRSAADPAIFAAQSSSALAAQIGLPMQPGWRIRGRANARHGSGNADLQIPLSGPNGRGELIEWAQQEHSRWHLCSLTFRNENGRELLLVDPATTHCEPE
jgi:hypothetical protein